MQCDICAIGCEVFDGDIWTRLNHVAGLQVYVESEKLCLI